MIKEIKEYSTVEVAKDRIITLKDWNFKGFRGIVLKDYDNGIYDVLFTLQNHAVVLTFRKNELEFINNLYEEENEN